MAHVSHKLNNAFEGALAGGGDPATSPLYVFGPFLRLIVVAGVAQITFGASLWMVVLTIAVVSAMYRLVMKWVTDGSGGSGLSEEEFGSWAVKINAAITFIEYTLTFLVSMAAMVTFIADRLPVLNEEALGIQYRTFIAITLSLLTGLLVNRGPKMAARVFGPATAGVLLLLWAMIFATIFKLGFRLPDFNLAAFNPANLGFTIGGYVRILAVMTGIEVFANLVAAYGGTPAKKSKKAFNSLLIIMGTTGLTMLIVGPAIFDLADPTNEHVSVFTQTMDQLLPTPLPIIGTIVGIAVLMSASAASAQGLQNLALGLKDRHYIPASLGQVNQFEVADKPVWIEVGIVSITFLFFGTHEETYLAIYAAGVFILLTMTGAAVTNRLVRNVRETFNWSTAALIVGTIFATILTAAATFIIFFERFADGAWTYLLFIPILYAAFSYFRKRFGPPTIEKDAAGQFNAAQLAGFGFGQYPSADPAATNGAQELEITWQPEPIEKSQWRDISVDVKHLIILLDGSDYAAQALPLGRRIGQATGAKITLLSSIKNHTSALQGQFDATQAERVHYLTTTAAELTEAGCDVAIATRPGQLADATAEFVSENSVDLIVTSTRGKSGAMHWSTGGVTTKLLNAVSIPLLLVQTADQVRPVNGEVSEVKRILVALDGSIPSEEILPYARALVKAFEAELVLLAVPEMPTMDQYRAPSEAIELLRTNAEANMSKFLGAVARSLRESDINVKTLVTGSLPARTIVSAAKEQQADLIMLTSRGRGGLDLLYSGSVAQRVVENTDRPVFMMPVRRPDAE